jgi:competence protein ComEC
MAEFKCVIWSVEHGSSAYITCPNGKTMLLDAGKSKDFSPVTYLADHYKHSRITKLIISHPHRDHIEDLPNIVSQIKPKILMRNKEIPQKLIYPSADYLKDEAFKAYKELDETYIHPVSEEDKSTPAENWGGVEIKTYRNKPDWLTSPSLNNLSLLTIVNYMDFEIVFPGDLEPAGWDALIENTNVLENVGKGKICVLVASHHGRRSGIRTSEGKI